MSVTALCECGCGGVPPIAKRTRPYLGHIKGQPTRFCHGHGSRARLGLERYEVVDAGYDTPCWIWQGQIAPDTAYGLVWAGRPRRKIGAHRALYEASVGSIPAGLDLDHLCRVRACVNPAHLEPVTRSVNVRRGIAARRAA